MELKSVFGVVFSSLLVSLANSQTIKIGLNSWSSSQLIEIAQTNYISHKFADFFQMAASYAICGSIRIDSTHLPSVSCVNSPPDPFFFDLPKYGESFQINQITWYSSEGCSTGILGGFSMTPRILINTWNQTCQGMPTILSVQPSNKSIVLNWAASNYIQITYDNLNLTTCNVESSDIYIGLNKTTFKNSPIGKVFPSNFSALASSINLKFNLTSLNLLPNNETFPWYYFAFKMKDYNRTRTSETETYQFCVPKASSIPTCVYPTNLQSVPSLTTDSFTFTFKWKEPTDWGYYCGSNPKYYSLYFEYSKVQGVIYNITTPYYTFTLPIEGNGKIFVWAIRANDGSWSALSRGTTCIENTPSTPTLISPLESSQNIGNVTLIWLPVNFADVCNLSSTSFQYELFIGTNSTPLSLFDTVNSTTTSYYLSVANFNLPDTGLQLDWMVRAIISFGTFKSLGAFSPPRTFYLCEHVHPSTPTNLQVRIAEGSTLQCNGSAISVILEWDNVTNWGKHCVPPQFVSEYHLISDLGNFVASQNHLEIFVIDNAPHFVNVSAHNGDSFSDVAIITFDLCKKTDEESSKKSLYIIVIIEFDTTITDVTQIENEIATILGIDQSLVNVILISSTEIQVTISGGSLSDITNSVNQFINQINDGSIETGLLRNAIDAYLRGDQSHQISFAVRPHLTIIFLVSCFLLIGKLSKST